jgi:hypothetical protein
MALDLGPCVLCFLSPYPEILIPLSPDIFFARGFIPAHLHAFDQDECHISGTYFPRTKFWLVSSDKINFAPSGPLKARSSVCGGGGGGVLFERADPEYGHDKGAGLHGRRSNPRENLAGFELSGARRRDSELRQVVICDPSFVFRIGGMARLVFDGDSRARVRQSGSAWSFDLVAWWVMLVG